MYRPVLGLKRALIRRVGVSTTQAVLLATLLLIVGCGDGDDAPDAAGETLEVVASTSIVADWVANVGGEHVTVTSLVPRATDAHSYVLVPSDIQRIASADVVFMIGESFEASFADAVFANADGPIYELTKGLPLQPFPTGLAHEDEHGAGDQGDEGSDPHIFLDPELATAAVEHIRDALTERDPANRDTYASNAEAYVATLRQLDSDIAAQLAKLPENRRYLVTFHDAYGYFAARYGLTLLGFIVESPDEQPAASALAELIDAIRERDVEYIFTEPQFDSRVIDQLADDTGVEVREIPSDALSDEYPDYASFMRAIADGIAR